MVNAVDLRPAGAWDQICFTVSVAQFHVTEGIIRGDYLHADRLVTTVSSISLSARKLNDHGKPPTSF